MLRTTLNIIKVSGILCASAVLFVVNIAHANGPLQNVNRLYHPASGQHLQTADNNEIAQLTALAGWLNETPTFKAELPSGGSCDPGTVAVYRLYNRVNKDHHMMADQYEYNFWTVMNPNSDWNGEGVAFCAYSTQVASTAPVYRLNNTVSGEHFLTASLNEANAIDNKPDWHKETTSNGGIAFYAYPNP